MKILVTTFYYPNFKALADKTIPNHRAYCEKHGYTYVVNHEYPEDIETPYKAICRAGRSNVEQVLRNIQLENYVFTIGIDAIITDMEYSLEDLTDEDYDIHTGSDHAGINTSQMLVKNSKNAKDYFWEALGAIREGRTEHDQRYFWENPMDFIQETPQRMLNAYDTDLRLEPFNPDQTWQEGDFLVHLAGSTLEQRMGAVEKWLGRVK